MSDFREEEKLGKIYDTHLTRRIMKYLGPYRWHVTLAVSMSLVYMGMVSAGPYLFHVAIDWYIVPGLAQSITTKKALTGLFWTVVAYTASLLLSFGVQFVRCGSCSGSARKRCTTCARKFSSICNDCR